jgi:hypothetical protein
MSRKLGDISVEASEMFADWQQLVIISCIVVLLIHKLDIYTRSMIEKQTPFFFVSYRALEILPAVS